MAETYYDAIKNFSMDDMARFLRDMNTTDMIPKRWRCNSESCFRCNDDLICFREWLQQEVKHETKHNDTE